MICIHPTVTHDRPSLLRLQIATGMRIALGNSYLRLVSRETAEQKPAPKKITAPSSYSNNWDGNGGNAA